MEVSCIISTLCVLFFSKATLWLLFAKQWHKRYLQSHQSLQKIGSQMISSEFQFPPWCWKCLNMWHPIKSHWTYFVSIESFLNFLEKTHMFHPPNEPPILAVPGMATNLMRCLRTGHRVGWFRVSGSLYPYHPCMVYLYTYMNGWFFYGKWVGNIPVPWMLLHVWC